MALYGSVTRQLQLNQSLSPMKLNLLKMSSALLLVIVVLVLSTVLCKEVDDMKLLEVATELSSEVNCPVDQYPGHPMHHGFTLRINYEWGLIGYDAQFSTVFVTFKKQFESRPLTPKISVLDTTLAEYPNCHNCKVNNAFYQYEQFILNEVQQDVHYFQTMYPHAALVFVGYSTGGAIATIAATDLCHIFEKLVLITIGSPRVGNAEFALYASECISAVQRLTHGRDKIVHYPLSHSYYHINGM